MDLRSLSLEDLPAAMELENSMPGSPMWFPVDSEYQQKLIQNGLNFGMFDGNKLIGKVGFWSETEGEYEVDGMILAEKYRHQGNGFKLFSYAEKELISKKRPKKELLFTHPENIPAITLYEQVGFIKKGIIRDKYGPGKDRLKMEKLLI